MRFVILTVVCFFLFFAQPVFSAQQVFPDGNGGIYLERPMVLPFTSVRTNSKAQALSRLVEFFGYWEDRNNVSLGYEYKNLEFLQALVQGVFSSEWGISQASFNALRTTGFPVTVISGDLNVPPFVSALSERKKLTVPYERVADLNVSIGGVAFVEMLERPFVVHFPIETVTSGSYDFFEGKVRLRQPFTIRNNGGGSAFILERRISSFFHNRVSSATVFVKETVVETVTEADANGWSISYDVNVTKWRRLNPWPFTYNGETFYHSIEFLPQTKTEFLLEYLVEPNSSGKFDFIFSPEPQDAVLDPYWLLSGTSGFDPVESVYPTAHDFNRTYLNSDQNLTFNGQLDWNSETTNQIISDANLVFRISFNDFNGTHFVDSSNNHIDFNLGSGGGGTYQVGEDGILGTDNASACDPSAAEACNMQSGKGSFFSNLPAASISLWFWNPGTIFYDTNNVLFSSDNNLLRVEMDLSSHPIASVKAKWGSSGYTVCDSFFEDTFYAWNHVVVVSGSPNRIFLNGRECVVYSQTSNFSSSGTVNAVYFADPNLSPAIDRPNLDEARFFNKALSVADANTLYYYGALDENLVYYYQFNSQVTNFANVARYPPFKATEYVTEHSYVPAMFDTIGPFQSTEAALQGFSMQDNPYLDCTQSCSFSLWYKDANRGNINQLVIRHANPSAAKQQYNFRCDTNATGRLNFIGGNGASGVSHFTLNRVCLPRWRHYAFTFNKDENRVRLYVDGNMEATGTFGFTLQGGSGTNLLFTSQLPAVNMSGTADEIKFWNRVLSDDEIIRDYNSWWRASYVSEVFDTDENAGCTDCNFSKGKISFDNNASMSGMQVFGRTCTNLSCSTNPAWTQELGPIVKDQNFDLNNGSGYRAGFLQIRFDFDANNAWDRNNWTSNFLHIRQAQFWFDFLPMALTVIYPNAANLILFEDFWIDFNILSPSVNALGLLFDLNLSIGGIEGTGHVIVDNASVASTPGFYCDSNILTTSTQCHYYLRVDQYPQGRYKVFVKGFNDFVSVSDASDNNFFLLNARSASNGFIVLPDSDSDLWIIGAAIGAIALIIALARN